MFNSGQKVSNLGDQNNKRHCPARFEIFIYCIFFKEDQFRYIKIQP